MKLPTHEAIVQKENQLRAAIRSGRVGITEVQLGRSLLEYRLASPFVRRPELKKRLLLGALCLAIFSLFWGFYHFALAYEIAGLRLSNNFNNVSGVAAIFESYSRKQNAKWDLAWSLIWAAAYPFIAWRFTGDRYLERIVNRHLTLLEKAPQLDKAA